MGRDSNGAQTETREPHSLLTVVHTSDSLMEGTGTFSDAEPNIMGPIRTAYDGSEFDILGRWSSLPTAESVIARTQMQ